MSEHAKLSPSAAKQWLTCPGSLVLTRGLPDSESSAARRGTVLHAWAAAAISNTEPVLPEGFKSEEMDDLSPEEQRLLMDAVGHAMRVIAANRYTLVKVEQKVAIAEAFGLKPHLLWGTADVIAYKPGELLVLDFKFGFEEVEAEDNPQLTLYAIGAARTWPAERYRLVIVQPQNDVQVREQVLTDEQLQMRRAAYYQKVRDAADALSSDEAALVPSDEGCRWCRAEATCPARHEEAQALVKATFQAIEPVEYAQSLTEAQMLQVLAQADRVKGFIAAVQERAKAAIVAGGTVPGWKVVRSNKHRKWKDEKAAIEALSAIGDEADFMEPAKLKSPAQVEKALKLKGKVLDELAPKPEGDPVLARDDDPRPALEAVFQKVEA